MKPSEVIDKALTEVLTGPEKWTKGMTVDREGRCCMAGALMTAASTCTLDGLVDYSLDTGKYALYMEVRKAVLKMLRETQGRQSSIPFFNDDPERTFDEVREVLEKTRAALQERGE